jgi:hypothetical protein
MSAIPCREQIAAKLKDVLMAVTSLPGLTGLTLERNRKTTLAGADLDSLIQFEGDELTSVVFTGEDSYELPLMLQATFAANGESAATRSNFLRATLIKALLADRTLGGLARDILITDPGNWVGVDCDSDDVEGFMLGLLVKYATVEGDPFTFSN